MTTEGAPQEAPAVEDGWTWAIVEIFGHRKHAGRTREEERFGAKLLRVDVPKSDDTKSETEWETHYYGGSAIFSFTPTTEDVVARLNRRFQPALPYRPDVFDDEDDESEDI